MTKLCAGHVLNSRMAVEDGPWYLIWPWGIVEEGRRFASLTDLNISDMSQQAPVGTTLALLERSMKVMSAVQARLHAAMKQEFEILEGIVRDNGPHSYPYDQDGNEMMS